MNGLYYYKLVSEYPEDVTKNCKLTINEIDHDFKTLKDEDIKSAELDEDAKAVILTRNNGDKLVVDLTPILSGSVYDLSVEYENPSDSGACKGANVYVTYSTLTSGDVKTTVTVPITGLVTTDNINDVLGGGFLSRVITDGTLSGEGTVDSPLGISETEKNRPAIKIIDKTKGEQLPETFTRGTRYVTKEYMSEFGYLYDFYAVQRINEHLMSEGKGWRVPTKADWDCLLNSIEPCDYRDHNSAICHQILGKYAGKKLKSSCGWKGQDDCECKITKPLHGQYCADDDATDEPLNDYDDFDAVDPDDAQPESPVINCSGTDDFGMRILPTGFNLDGDRLENYFNEKKTIFWTTTHIYNDLGQDVYTKQFNWNTCGVIQEALCPDAWLSIRLVKDYTGSNHFETETIDGDNYNTILFPDCGTVWTASNFASSKSEYRPKKANMGQNPYKRVVYFINVWNGKEWEKRALKEGETIVIMEGNEHCQYNIEYRVYTEDDCNQVLVSTDSTTVERVLDEIIPLIDEERKERISADTELWEALNEEVSARTEADLIEKEEREAADTILQDEIESEIIRAQDVEQQLWDAINQEAQAREDVDQQLWDAIAQEASARTDVDNQLWDAINNESERAQDVEGQLWDAIAQEASARTDVDNQLWDALAQEASARTDVDNQLWVTINKENEDRIAAEEGIDGQFIDASKNPFILEVNSKERDNLVLETKDGNEEHFIRIKVISDFGTF